MIESESEYISGDVSSTQVKVCLHNVSSDVSIFVGSMKWGNIEIRLIFITDSELNTKDLKISIAALRMRSGSKNNHW